MGGGGGTYNRDFTVCSCFHVGDAVAQNVWPAGMFNFSLSENLYAKKSRFLIKT